MCVWGGVAVVNAISEKEASSITREVNSSGGKKCAGGKKGAKEGRSGCHALVNVWRGGAGIRVFRKQ